jgi:CheY-like chemotaxis protein
MEISPQILVATDVATDGSLVADLLESEFPDVAVSHDPETHVADFDQCRPQVLILAFKTLEKAERYYLGLYRFSSLVHAHPHRTLILCTKEDLKRVFELCKQEYFDDYILFWPMIHDVPRLPMAVILALRQLSANGMDQTSTRELSRLTARIAELEAKLAAFGAAGRKHASEMRRSILQASEEIDLAIDGLSRKLVEEHVVDTRSVAAFEQEISRFKTGRVSKAVAAAQAASEPLTVWIDSIDEVFAPQVSAAAELKAVSDGLRPIVLVVEDDALQLEMLAVTLAELGAELVFARSGTEALSSLRRHRPDLVLMDINLPGIDGIEATRKLKSIEGLESVPVIMMTGHSDRKVVVDSLLAGASDFVVKPLDRTILLSKIRGYLNP